MKMFNTIITPLFILCSAIVSQAAVVFAGAIADDSGNEITRWATSTVTKTLDADGNNHYGSYAGEFVGVVNNNLPDINFISIGAGNSVVGPFPGYATVDNDAGGSGVVRTTTGPTISNVITYVFQDANVALNAPNGIRVGLFTDGLDGAGFTGGSYSVEHIRGGGSLGTATSVLAPNAVIDGHFFDVTSIQTGDWIRFSTVRGANGNFATFQGFSADIIIPSTTPVPEPSSALLVGLGGLAFMFRRRR